jgi:hypothetical protein
MNIFIHFMFRTKNPYYPFDTPPLAAVGFFILANKLSKNTKITAIAKSLREV